MNCIFKNAFLLPFNIGNIKEALLKEKLRSVRFSATSQRAISPNAERVINIHRGVRFDLLFRQLIALICSLQKIKSRCRNRLNRLKGVERNYTYKYGYIRREKEMTRGTRGAAAFVPRYAITAYLNSFDMNYTSGNNTFMFHHESNLARPYLLGGFANQVSFFSLAFIPDLSPSPPSFLSAFGSVSFCRCIFFFFFFPVEYYKLLIISKLAACWAALSSR